MTQKTYRAARVRSASFDADTNCVDIVWTTGAAVRRCDPYTGEEYDEVLSLEPGAVRLERLNSGAPFLDTHSDESLANVIGSIVPGSAKISGGQGVAKIQLSSARGVADTVQKISEGTVRNVSVGYWIHKIVKTESDKDSVARWDIVDWEPLEVSAVPIPADAGSQIRSAAGRKQRTMSKDERDHQAGAAMVARLTGKTAPRGPYRSQAPVRGAASEQREVEAGAAKARRLLGKKR